MDQLNIFNLNNALEPTTMAMANPMSFGDRGGALSATSLAMTVAGCLLGPRLTGDASGGHGMITDDNGDDGMITDDNGCHGMMSDDNGEVEGVGMNRSTSSSTKLQETTNDLTYTLKTSVRQGSLTFENVKTYEGVYLTQSFIATCVVNEEMNTCLGIDNRPYRLFHESRPDPGPSLTYPPKLLDIPVVMRKCFSGMFSPTGVRFVRSASDESGVTVTMRDGILHGDIGYLHWDFDVKTAMKYSTGPMTYVINGPVPTVLSTKWEDEHIEYTLYMPDENADLKDPDLRGALFNGTCRFEVPLMQDAVQAPEEEELAEGVARLSTGDDPVGAWGPMDRLGPVGVWGPMDRLSPVKTRYYNEKEGGKIKVVRGKIDTYVCEYMDEPSVVMFGNRREVMAKIMSGTLPLKKYISQAKHNSISIKVEAPNMTAKMIQRGILQWTFGPMEWRFNVMRDAFCNQTHVIDGPLPTVVAMDCETQEGELTYIVYVPERMLLTPLDPLRKTS